MEAVTLDTIKSMSKSLNIDFNEVATLSVKELSRKHYMACRQSSNDTTGEKRRMIDFWSKCIGLKMVKAI